MTHAHFVKDIILKENITTWFQPVVNLNKRGVSGWEALTRGPSISSLHSAAALFKAAAKAELLKPLELMCIRNATKCFEQLQLGGKLFVNVSHEMLLAGNVLREQLKALIAEGPVPSNRIVLELSEKFLGDEDPVLTEAIEFFHQLGFQIALDDIGAGQSTPDQWPALKPDYVKVDRHFVNGIDQDDDKQQFVRSVVANTRSLHAKVIAEGVETRAEMQCLRDLGIHECQGFLFQRPELAPVAPDLSHILSNAKSDALLACDLVMSQAHVDPDTNVDDLLAQFDKDPDLASIAVVDKGVVSGLIARDQVRNNNGALVATELMEAAPLTVDSHARLAEVARLVSGRGRQQVYKDFIVTSGNQFLGIAQVADLLRQLARQLS